MCRRSPRATRTSRRPTTTAAWWGPGRAFASLADLGLQQHLDRASLVHRPVGLGSLVQRKGEVEDPAGLDPPRHDVLQQLWEVAADRREASAEADVPLEHLPDRQLDPVRDADEP